MPAGRSAAPAASVGNHTAERQKAASALPFRLTRVQIKWERTMVAAESSGVPWCTQAEPSNPCYTASLLAAACGLPGGLQVATPHLPAGVAGVVLALGGSTHARVLRPGSARRFFPGQWWNGNEAGKIAVRKGLIDHTSFGLHPGVSGEGRMNTRPGAPRRPAAGHAA
jgi:hypothetical protein